MPVVLNLPRDGGLDNWPKEELRGPNFGCFANASSKLSANYDGWYALSANFLTGMPTFDDFDAFATVGRGRVTDPKYRFTIQKQYSWLSGTRYVVTDVEFSCDIEDLYDFNYEDGEKSAAAAALQLGFGRGTGASLDRNSRGRIFRHTIQIRKTYPLPFTYNTY